VYQNVYQISGCRIPEMALFQRKFETQAPCLSSYRCRTARKHHKLYAPFLHRLVRMGPNFIISDNYAIIVAEVARDWGFTRRLNRLTVIHPSNTIPCNGKPLYFSGVGFFVTCFLWES